MLAAPELAISQLLFAKFQSEPNTDKHSHSVQTSPWASSRDGSKAPVGSSMGYSPLSLHESPNTINLLSGCFHRLCTRRGSPREGSYQARYRMPHTPRPTMRAKRVKSFKWSLGPTPAEKEIIVAANSTVGNTEIRERCDSPSQLPHHQ